MWVTLIIKVVFGLATVVVLDMFCGIGLSVVSWFLVATPFIITALATAISIGVSFDAYVLGNLTEKFTDKKHKPCDVPVPNPSNTIE
jgi:hypothetical protein